MGNGRWDAADWASYSAKTVRTKSRDQIFTSTQMKPEYDPAKIEMRESRDSADNPASTPIILASDVTGSMGMIAEKIMRNGLNTLATEIYARKPVTDPHIAIMAVGDGYSDRAPLQVTQFEADIRVADQARSLWLEGNGGGNGGESYTLAHLFAATKVRHDAFDRRGKKGYLFTIGDEPVHETIPEGQIRKILGMPAEHQLESAEVVRMASEKWEIFHIVLTNEGYCLHARDRVLASWRKILPERTLQLGDVNALAETVVSTIQVTEGARPSDVAASWSGSTALAVADAIGSLPAKAGRSRGLVRL